VTIAALAAGACGSLGAMFACITDPPPDLPPIDERPEIVQDALQPPQGTLTSLPPEFTVPIDVPDPGACAIGVFDVTTNQYVIPCQPCVSAIDGGVVLETFNLDTLDPATCQTLRVIVAADFSTCGVPNTTLGDTATWVYTPATCLWFDAGAIADGAFPDVASDGLPLVPESGGGS